MRLPSGKQRTMVTVGSRRSSTRSWTDPMLDGSTIAVIDDHGDVERVIEELSRSGVDLRMVSVVGRAPAPHEGGAGFYTLGGHIGTWGGVGAFWGRIWGVLLGAAVFWVPGLGLVAAAGPFVQMLAADVGDWTADPAASSRVIAGTLADLGVPADRIAWYEVALRDGRYVMITRGPPQEVEAAREVLEQGAAAKVDVLDAVGDAARRP